MLKVNGYRVDLAKRVGVIPSIILSYIDGLEKDSESHYTTTRKEIFNGTALSDAEQIDAEATLTEMGIISVSLPRANSDKIKYTLFEQKVVDVLNSSDDGLEDVFGGDLFRQLCPLSTTSAVAKPKKEKKVESLKATAMRLVDGKCSQVEAQYICDWIDSVILGAKGFLTEASLKLNIDLLFSHTNDENIRIGILKTAIKSGHKDLQWSIDSYERSNKNKRASDMDVFCSYEDTVSNGEDVADEVF